MNEATIDLDQTDEDILLAAGTPDEALEAAGGKVPDPYKSIYLQFGC